MKVHEINSVPQDTIMSAVCENRFVLASWDCKLCLYSSDALELIKQVCSDSPVTRVILSSGTEEGDDSIRVITGDIEGKVCMYDGFLNKTKEIQSGVGGIQFLHQCGSTIVVGGWNKKIVFIESSGIRNTLDTDGKIHCSAIIGDILICGQHNSVVGYNISNCSVFFRRLFDMPVRSLAIHASGFFAGTTSGRIYYEDFANGDNSYVFNAHYDISGEVKTFYPVNALVIHKHLYSGGSDGKLLRWRLGSKKTCKVMHTQAVGVSSICTKTNRLFVTFSYTHDNGQIDKYSSKAFAIDI
ncbi:mitotic spindle checkpoint protein Bub3 [Ordospora colligata]|uniref:WD40 domain-containing protein n=1 Tax=Ordospora colligata OC4 TaxID=1354746 RepID=A0A0B2UJB1_9MICR|nr:uncharacterized protein M896_090680 [Ordospora colligata OC4]KHN69142.1 hypothetical protein M896_090680 [Ordospora colligata OC4]TBU14791.1 hypothetical protein CWI40_090690 [Ordospora colligata]